MRRNAKDSFEYLNDGSLPDFVINKYTGELAVVPSSD